MIVKAIVGHRIASLRKALGYAQAAFAQKLHVSTQAVSKWETGLALPDIEVLLNIAWMGNTSIHTLLEGDDFIEARGDIDRGLMHASRFLICPQCRERLIPQKPAFACSGGHRYALDDGVLHFGTREVEGELWSLWLRNYEHYLLEQRHPGNPRYWQGQPHYREVMWQRMEKLRPRVILDVACGTGSGIKYMIERIDWPTTIIMADVSHRILKWNRVFYGDECRNPYVDMVYLACDCARLPLADGCIDLVFSNGGFESMRQKMMDGFREAFRVLKPGGHALYNMSTIDDRNCANTQAWLSLLSTLDAGLLAEEAAREINDWLETCRKTGFNENEAIKIYDELRAPTDGVFPFENEVLQWMAAYVMVSEK